MIHKQTHSHFSLEHLIDALILPTWLSDSAWHEHIPFAMYIVAKAQPRLLVELGTHWGVSYCAFCEAVLTLNLNTQLYAIDTWEGDPHSGFYGEEIFQTLMKYHGQRYSSFSTLLRKTFDESLSHFQEHSIDLLHIDGYHTYEATQANFTNWLPKMSDQGIILFHDISVRQDDFGVWKLWNELVEIYPSFQFNHGHGLGMLLVGKDCPPNLQNLFQADEYETALLRKFFAYTGTRWKSEHECLDAQRHLNMKNKVLEEQRQQLVQREDTIHIQQNNLTQQENILRKLQSQVEQKDATIQYQQTHLTELENNLIILHDDIKKKDNFIERQQKLISQHEAKLREQSNVIEEQQIIGFQHETTLNEFQTILRKQSIIIERQQSLLDQHKTDLNKVESILSEERINQKYHHGILEKELHMLEKHVILLSSQLEYLQENKSNLENQIQTLQEQLFISDNYIRLYLMSQSDISLFTHLKTFIPGFKTLRLIRAAWVIYKSDLFDPAWYLETYPDVKREGQNPIWHYLLYGVSENRNPNLLFYTKWYLQHNPDVAYSGMNPFVHYIRFGITEARKPNPFFTDNSD